MKRVSRAKPAAKVDGKGAFYSDKLVQRLGDRRITLYRRRDVRDSSWYVCVYLREENRQYRVSLKTDDLDIAKRKAERVIIDVLGRVGHGERILAPALADVLSKYEQEQQRLVASQQISTRTVEMQRYRIRRGLRFVGEHYPA